jgi:hypothetical protein
MADSTQQDVATTAGKYLLAKKDLPAPQTEGESPHGLWRDNEEIKWNSELACWEYASDGAVFFCSRLETDSLDQHTARKETE